jgi:Spy/CpxP family protein refolding chaperone
MKSKHFMHAGLAFAIAAAAPGAALAQATSPAPPAAAGEPAAKTGEGPHRGGRAGPLKNLSPEGRQIMREAARRDVSQQDREAMRAARERVLTLLAADPLDVNAIRQAQAEERSIAQKNHMERQEALLAGYQKLSPADRKAFVEGMREMEGRIGDRMKMMRGHHGDRKN